MPDLQFTIAGAEAPRFAATPMLAFELHIANRDAQETIHTVALRCQIRFEVTQRHYSPESQQRLLEVFGEPERWDSTLHDMLWTHVSMVVPQFTGSTTISLPVPCTYDFEVVGTKYFAALTEGQVPLIFLFSGTVFYQGAEGQMQISQVPWSKEATYRLPIATWREMIAHYYPNTAWLRVSNDVFDRLAQYKAQQGFPTWDEALNHLLEHESKEAHPWL